MNTKGIGKHQKYVLGKLKEGYWIRVEYDLKTTKEKHSLTNGKDNLWVCKTVAMAFEKRGILTSQKVYSTTQPDTETWEYRINLEEWLEEFKARCEQEGKLNEDYAKILVQYSAALKPQQPDNQSITN